MSQSLAKSKSVEDKHTLDMAKKEVYTAVMTAQESKLQELTANLQSESGRNNRFRLLGRKRCHWRVLYGKRCRECCV